MVPKPTSRSVKDATRFTATAPHAHNKAPASRKALQSPASVNMPRETPEERVRRLRAAHLAARNAQTDTFEHLAAKMRPWMDSAHRITVLGILGFSGIAALVTAYTVYDMMRFNRQRKEEFFAVQAQLDDESLAAARLAYMRNEATPEQVALVEYMQDKAVKEGFKLPPLLAVSDSPDGAADAVDSKEKTRTLAGRAGKGAPMEQIPIPIQPAAQPTPLTDTYTRWFGKVQDRTASGGGGLFGWISRSLGRAEQGEDVGSSEARLGYESLSEEDEGTGVRESDMVRAVEDKAEALKAKAREAFEKEKENQRRGGPLDRIGLEEQGEKKGQEGGKKKGWW